MHISKIKVVFLKGNYHTNEGSSPIGVIVLRGSREMVLFLGGNCRGVVTNRVVVPRVVVSGVVVSWVVVLEPFYLYHHQRIDHILWTEPSFCTGIEHL